MTKIIIASGPVIVENGKVLLNKHGEDVFWKFCGGKVEDYNTNLADNARREVKEEMGITRIRVIAPLGRIDWWFRERRGTAHSPKGALVNKFAYYFLMQVPTQTKLKAQKSELIRAVRFVPIVQALKLSGYKDVQPVLKKALDILSRA